MGFTAGAGVAGGGTAAAARAGGAAEVSEASGAAWAGLGATVCSGVSDGFGSINLEIN
jgi:hypothetical protein